MATIKSPSDLVLGAVRQALASTLAAPENAAAAMSHSYTNGNTGSGCHKRWLLPNLDLLLRLSERAQSMLTLTGSTDKLSQACVL